MRRHVVFGGTPLVPLHVDSELWTENRKAEKTLEVLLCGDFAENLKTIAYFCVNLVRLEYEGSFCVV
jgi:hypothetical protein